jgi:hypothetical protein
MKTMDDVLREADDMAASNGYGGFVIGDEPDLRGYLPFALVVLDRDIRVSGKMTLAEIRSAISVTTESPAAREQFQCILDAAERELKRRKAIEDGGGNDNGPDAA